ncbi:MAG TPA: DUF1489 domain-containing protein [Hyphomicrobiaceae bacterium]|nr:DUF1489 domain-containing protein [Hyphomicrobiaceae bacterium]
MPLHIVKLCVGADSIEDLAQWQKGRLAAQKAAKVATPRIFHTTYMKPKRESEVLDGGSLYWVIKGIIQVRQRITGFGDGQKEDGTPACLIYLDRQLVPVRPVPRRAFQGWRYLEAADAPADLGKGETGGLTDMPPALRKELASLGLL